MKRNTPRREEIINGMLENGVIAIMRGVKGEALFKTADALLAGGIRYLELAFDQRHPETHKDTADAIAAIIKHTNGKLCMGAGTVLTKQQLKLVQHAGAEFIVSPGTNPAIIKATVRAGLVSAPGAMTPSEADIAWRAGADFIKLFPFAQMNPSYIKELCTPLGHMRFLAVGGVNPDNVAEVIAAGACGIGVGGGLVKVNMINAGDFDGITRCAQAYTQAIKQAKGL